MSIQRVAILRNVGGLVFDATLREAHTSEIELTENPIELGSEVSDHMYVKPKKLTICAGVSNTTLHDLVDDQFAGDSRMQAAFDLLTNLQESGEPFSIQTGLRFYPQMMCLCIRAEQDKDTDDVLYFEADFKAVEIVSTQTVTYTPKKVRTGTAPKKKGEQQGTQVTDKQKQQSLLRKLSDVFFNKGAQ